ncbi:MAG TPA: GAF domain-containing protein, partial [Candidatus Manganitrophaceae bacterium]
MPKDFGKSGQIPRAWQSLPSIILQQGGTLVSNEISKDPRFVGQVIRGMNVQTFIGFSLRSEDKILGSLSLGFSKPDALHPGEEEVVATISKLVCPFLIQRAPEAEPEAKKEAPLEEPFVIGLDMAGRIVSINSRFAQYVGQTNEALRKTPLSQLLTPAGGAAYSDQLEALKSGQKNLPPFRLEVIKKGDLKGVLLAQLSLLQKDGKASGVELTAQDATEKGALEKEILKKNVELGILQSLFSSLSRSFKEEDVFKEVLQKAISLMDVEGGYLLHLDEKKQRLFLLAQKGLSAEKAQRLSKQGIKIGENIIGKMIEKLSPILAVAADVKAPLKKRWIGEEGLISYMGTPVKASGQAWGTLSLFSRTKFFTEDDLQVLSFIGKEIGFAIDNMNLFDDARRRVEDLTIINEVSQSITKSLHLEQLLSSVANSLTKMIGASNCYIFSIDDKR